MALIDWSGAATETFAITAAAFLTSPWWATRVGIPLVTLCKTHLFRAKLEQDNAGRIRELDEKVEANGEQTALAADQNRRMFDLLQAASMEATPDGMVTWVSMRWSQFAGIDRASAVGNGWFKAIQPPDYDMTTEAYKQAVKNGEPIPLEYHFKTGMKVFHLMEPVKYKGKLIGWKSDFTHITEGGARVGESPIPVIALMPAK